MDMIENHESPGIVSTLNASVLHYSCHVEG